MPSIDIPDERLVERAVRNAHPKRGIPKWSAVAKAFGLGSTYACELCARFGLDPHAVRPMPATDTPENLSSVVEMQGCEHCSAEVPIEDAVYSEGCYFCPKCYAEWKAHFDTCEHSWEPHYDEYGTPGRYCNKCCGFVADEKPPLTAQKGADQ